MARDGVEAEEEAAAAAASSSSPSSSERVLTRRSDPLLVVCRCFGFIVALTGLLCVTVNVLSAIRSFKNGSDVFDGIFRCYAVVLALIVVVVETEWSFVFRFWKGRKRVEDVDCSKDCCGRKNCHAQDLNFLDFVVNVNVLWKYALYRKQIVALHLLCPFCIIVFSRRTEALEYWAGRGMLQIFVAVMTRAFPDLTSSETGLILLENIASYMLLACGLVYVIAGLLCIGFLKRARQQEVISRTQAVRDLEELERRKEELEQLLLAERV